MNSFPAGRNPRVVVVGGGFGGLTLARSLSNDPVDITLLDRSNHHLFQPLLYQVAMAGLSPAEIAAPIRGILGKQSNVRVLMTNVERADLDARTLHTSDGPVPYDYLVVAAGARTSYFGHSEWEAVAPGLKSIDDATEIRRRVLTAFEDAEKSNDPARVDELLNFVVIGGGPTGVELAGSINELARFVLDSDFRSIRAGRARVTLLEAGPRILSSMDPSMSDAAMAQLKELGVAVCVGERVLHMDMRGVTTDLRRINAATVLWGAGVEANPLGKALGVPVDRSGRVLVEPDCSLPGHPEAFCIGDMAAYLHTADKNPLPGVSPVAMQQARYVARFIAAEAKGEPRGKRPPFRYVDKGSMATIGRSRAVAQAGGFRMRGLLAWLAWLAVHIWYLIGFRNRLVVMLTWAWSYFTFKRGARLITGTTGHTDPAPVPAEKSGTPAQAH